MSAAKVDPPVRAELVEIYASPEGFGGWSYLRFQESTGFVSIASDYGHWTYHWIPRHRSESLGHFLARIDSGYAGGKFLGAGLEEPDEQATEDAVKAYIEEQRGRWEDDRIESELALADAITCDGIQMWLYETTISDAYEMVVNRVVASWRVFWERVWEPLFRPALAEWPRDKDAAAVHEAALAGKGDG